MRDLAQLQELLVSNLQKRSFGEKPANLYEPFHYILGLGGKRLRPVLTLLACEAFGKPAEDALEASMGIELFHNFSLIHDDIMDNAPLRRGQPTVHEKWNLNIGILAGDGMLVEAFKQVAKVEDTILRDVIEVFSQTAREVCEGQQMDMDFETQMEVKESEYIQMIQFKTSVLLGAALEIGALIGGADDVGAKQAYSFGLNMGTAFQIKDDLLDAFGDPEKFGKQVGGDILANKKTILLIHSLNEARGEDRENLLTLLKGSESGPAKVEAVKQIYNRVGSVEHAERRMESYYKKALASLDMCKEHGAEISHLTSFAHHLYHRDH